MRPLILLAAAGALLGPSDLWARPPAGHAGGGHVGGGHVGGGHVAMPHAMSFGGIRPTAAPHIGNFSRPAGGGHLGFTTPHQSFGGIRLPTTAAFGGGGLNHMQTAHHFGGLANAPHFSGFGNRPQINHAAVVGGNSAINRSTFAPHHAFNNNYLNQTNINRNNYLQYHNTYANYLNRNPIVNNNSYVNHSYVNPYRVGTGLYGYGRGGYGYRDPGVYGGFRNGGSPYSGFNAGGYNGYGWYAGYGQRHDGHDWHGGYGHGRPWYGDYGYGYRRPWFGGGWYRPWAPYYWASNYGYWNYGWSPAGLWLGALASGLLDSYSYANPYYVAPSAVLVPDTLNYSVPLVVPTEDDLGVAPATDGVVDGPMDAPVTPSTDVPPADGTAPANPAPVNQSDDPKVRQAGLDFDAARASFRDGDFPKAEAQIDQAIGNTPGDPNLHQFRALSLFAQGRYEDSAAALYAVLNAGPGWNWETMVGFYPNVDIYTAQLRSLEAFVRQNPNAGYGHFVLAYQYLVTGAQDAAVRQLQDVVRLVPDDKLSAAILKAITNPQPQTQPQAPVAPQSQPQPSAPQTIPPASP